MALLTGDATAAGPAAAEVGSTAASLVCAAARDLGEAAIAAQAAALTLRLSRLAEADAEALAAARSAFPTDEAGESDERRDFAFGRALDRAADVPLEIAEACADVAALAQALAPSAGTASGPDVEAARLLAGGAARAAAHLVEVNLGVTEDDPRLFRARAAVQAAGR